MLKSHRNRVTPLLMLVIAAAPGVGSQAALTVKDLADYRLTRPVFERFVDASRLIAEATKADPRLAADPPFTREVAVLGDAAEVAPALEKRLSRDPALSAALAVAKMSAREYTVFALSLIGARLAHGFVKSGAMRFVPPGLASDNVAFIEAHQEDVAAVLRMLGVE
jgi:hypothetical protein